MFWVGGKGHVEPGRGQWMDGSSGGRQHCGVPPVSWRDIHIGLESAGVWETANKELHVRPGISVACTGRWAAAPDATRRKRALTHGLAYISLQTCDAPATCTPQSSLEVFP